MRDATREDGMVLIIVVGVLAMMSVMAFTFARYTTIERRAAENQTDADLARQLAQTGVAAQAAMLSRQAAAYRSYVSEYDGPDSWWALVGQPGASEACPTGSEPWPYGCKVLYEGDNLVGAVSYHEHDPNRQFYQGAGITDEDSKFNINAMGSLGDTGHWRDYTIRRSSFEASLARLIWMRLDRENIFLNSPHPHQFNPGGAAFIANRIVRRRYGREGIPGTPGTVRPLEQRPAFGQKHPELLGDDFNAWRDGNPQFDFTWTDEGVGFRTGPSWRNLGFDDGYANWFAMRLTPFPFLRAFAEEGVWWGANRVTDEELEYSWGDDTGPKDTAGNFFPSNALPLGAHSHVPSGIRGPDGTLYLEDNLVPYPPWGFKTDADYVPDDRFNTNYSNDPSEFLNNNRVYRSVSEVAPVIREAIRELTEMEVHTLGTVYITDENQNPVDAIEPLPGNEENISKAAGLIYRILEDYLTVHSRAWVATSVNINADWSGDGFDNTGDGIIDGPGEFNWNDPSLTEAERTQRLLALRSGLGLVERNPQTGAYETAYGLTIREANQLVVNIVDFMDGWTHEFHYDKSSWPSGYVDVSNKPTRFLLDADGTTELPNDQVVYGAEGLHVTEIMGTPPWIGASSGDRMQSSDYADENGWDWHTFPDPAEGWDGYFELVEDVSSVADPPEDPVIGHIELRAIPRIRLGWYAIRVFAGISGNDSRTLKIAVGPGTQPPDSDFFEIELSKDGDEEERWYYPRDDDGKLAAVFFEDRRDINVWIKVENGLADDRIRFYGIQLLPQFVSFTNIAKQSDFLDSSHGIDLSGWTLGFTDGDGTMQEFDLFASGLADDAARTLDRGADPPAPMDTTEIPAPRPDGFFPLNYGFLTIAIGEAAYDKNFGDKSGTWGDSADEAFPVYFVGDATGDAAADNAAIEAFLPGLQNVVVELRDGDHLMAGGEIDFIPTMAPGEPVGVDMEPYISKEKVSVISPNDRTNPWWIDCGFGFNVERWTRPPEIPPYSDVISARPHPRHLQASQNVLATVFADGDRGYDHYNVRTCMNFAYDQLWHKPEDPMGPNDYWFVFRAFDDLTDAHTVLPFILNRPYPNPAWMGLVPSGTPFRTIDPDPDPDTDPAGTHHMLGRLMKNAIVGGVHARINVNTASEEVLASVLDIPISFSTTRDIVLAIRNDGPFQTWDHFLNADRIWDARGFDGSHPARHYFAFWRNFRPRYGVEYEDVFLAEDSGAGTYADDFIGDSDEKEEWFRRFATLLDIRSHTFRTRVDGLVFEEVEDGETPRRPVAHARLEAVIDRSRDTTGDGRPEIRILDKRWIELEEE